MLVDRFRSAQKSVQPHQGRQFAAAPGGEERSAGGLAEAERADARGVVQGQHIVEVAVGFLRQLLLAHGALDEHAAPTVRSAVRHDAEEGWRVLHPAHQRQRRRVEGEPVGPRQPGGVVLEGNRRAARGGV